MEMTRRRLLGLAGAGLVTAFAGGLAGCSSEPPPGPAELAGSGSRARGTISVWTRY
jgi:hypothetical protein